MKSGDALQPMDCNGRAEHRPVGCDVSYRTFYCTGDNQDLVWDRDALVDGAMTGHNRQGFLAEVDA